MVIDFIVPWVLKYSFIRHCSTFAAACNNKTRWVYVEILSSNILVVKDKGCGLRVPQLYTMAGVLLFVGLCVGGSKRKLVLYVP